MWQINSNESSMDVYREGLYISPGGYRVYFQSPGSKVTSSPYIQIERDKFIMPANWKALLAGVGILEDFGSGCKDNYLGSQGFN